jgi:hypothetical protein
MATACFCEVTFLPEPPDFKVPAFHFFITFLDGIVYAWVSENWLRNALFSASDTPNVTPNTNE